MDQLEAHLRTLGAPAAEPDRASKEERIERPAPSPFSHAPIQLGIDQLESALFCVKNAAKAMADLDERAVSGAGMQEALAALERRLRGFEREFATVTEQLQDARRESEEHRKRSIAAETKLDSLVAAVAKMIAPLGQGEVAARHRLPPALQSPPALRGALTSNEVRA